MQGNFKGSPRSGEVRAAQWFLMAEFLMKSEPQGSDLMFHKVGDTKTGELWRGVVYFSWGNMGKACLPMTNSPPSNCWPYLWGFSRQIDLNCCQVSPDKNKQTRGLLMCLPFHSHPPHIHTACCSVVLWCCGCCRDKESVQGRGAYQEEESMVIVEPGAAGGLPRYSCSSLKAPNHHWAPTLHPALCQVLRAQMQIDLVLTLDLEK